MTISLRSLLQNFKYDKSIIDCDISNITYDSRKVKAGTLFVAIKGFNVDGQDFIQDAIENGAVAILSDDRNIQEISIPLIKVNNPRKIMSSISANFYGHPSQDMKIVGITGTNGKTSVTQLLNEILSLNNISCGTLGTLGFSTPSGMMNTGFTTPESIELQQLLSFLKAGGINHAIMEISSHSLEMHRVDDLSVDVAVFTNLTQDHLDFHHNLESYFQAKLKLFKMLNENHTAVINLDDPYAKRIIDNTTAKIITYGFDSNAHMNVISHDISLKGISAQIGYNNKIYNISSPLIGKFNLSNIMASLCAAISLDIPIEDALDAIKKYAHIPGRLENLSLNISGKVIVDYAHTPDAYNQVLKMIQDLSPDNSKIFTLFGCGGNRDHSKRSIMGEIAEKYSDKVFITSDNPRDENVKDICLDVSKGFSTNKYQVIYNRKDAIIEAMKQMDKNTILMILGKGRDNYEIIGSDKFPHNDIEIAESFVE